MLTAWGKERQATGLYERSFCSKHVDRLGPGQLNLARTSPDFH